MRIIQISGFRGIMTALFVTCCLASGFIGFPALALMKLWNFSAGFFAFPLINFWQGLMLWAIVAITLFLINDRKKYFVAFSPKNQLNDEEMKQILQRIQMQRAQMFNPMIISPEEFKKMMENKKEEKKDKENV